MSNNFFAVFNAKELEVKKELKKKICFVVQLMGRQLTMFRIRSNRMSKLRIHVSAKEGDTCPDENQRGGGGRIKGGKGGYYLPSPSPFL